MKRKELIKHLRNKGCYLLRHGSRHDIYFNPKNGLKQPVPRYSEIDDRLAKHIKKYLVVGRSNCIECMLSSSATCNHTPTSLIVLSALLEIMDIINFHDFKLCKT